MDKKGLLATVALCALSMSPTAFAQLYFHESVVNNCTGTCVDFAAFDVGTYISGTMTVGVTAPGTTWDASDISNIYLPMLNLSEFEEDYDGANPTTANPLPLNEETVVVEAASGILTTGGTVDVFGTLSGTVLLRFIIEPFASNDIWAILTFDPDRTVSLKMCAFFETAGCIPIATEFLTSDGLSTFGDLGEPMSAIPPSVDFGTILVGASAQASVTITSQGPFAVETFGVGGLFTPFGIRSETCSLQPLLPGDSCEVVVKFQPTTVNVNSDALVVSAYSDASVQVPMTGVGTDPLVDVDTDGVPDLGDNCFIHANSDQRDTDGDGLGNACDADLNGDCSVNFGDLADLKSAFFPNPYNEHADFNGDGFVNFGDLAFMKSAFFNGRAPGPGPSGVPNVCDGS